MRPTFHRPSPRRLFTIALVALSCGACSGGRAPLALEPQVQPGADALLPVRSPDSRPMSGSSFYPLEIGNAWSYDGSFSDDFFFDDGRAYHDERSYTQENVLMCEETVNGLAYLVERDSQKYGALTGLTQYVRYRQSAAGLFELDLPLNTPGCAIELEPSARAGTPPEPALPDAGALRAACLRAYATLMERRNWAMRAAGADPEDGVELTRLAYPLYVGARWRIRDEPLFTARVVGFEVLHLPAGNMSGFKIQIGSELFGPHDRVYSWVSRNGFLAFSSDLEVPIVDVDATIGVAKFHEDRLLTEFQVARHLPWSTQAAAPVAQIEP